MGSASALWSTVWAENGVIQTSSSKLKKEIREIRMKKDRTSELVSVAAATNASLPAKKSKNEDLQVPRGIIFKWKNEADVKTKDADFIGFMGDDLPLEAHAFKEDGTRDPEHFYTSAVVGLLCAKVRQQADQIDDLTARIEKLEKK